MTNEIAPLHPVVDSIPSLDELYDDLRNVRRNGARTLKIPVSKLPALLSVAAAVSRAPTDEAKVREVLDDAVAGLGGFSTPAMGALLGLTDETENMGPTDRRKKAAELYDYKTAGNFKANFERALLMSLAVQLRAMALGVSNPPTRGRILDTHDAPPSKATKQAVLDTRSTTYTLTKRRLYFEFHFTDRVEGELVSVDLLWVVLVVLVLVGAVAAIVTLT